MYPKDIRFIITPIDNLNSVNSILLKFINKYKSDISPAIEEIINLEVFVFNFNIELVVLSIRKSIIKFNIISSSIYIILFTKISI